MALPGTSLEPHANMRVGETSDQGRFLSYSSCSSHQPTVVLGKHAHSGNINHEAALFLGLKYLQACRFVLIVRFLGLSTSDNNNDINSNSNNNINKDEKHNQ